MGRNRVVVPEVVRVPISDGDYLDVKKVLNAGEYRDLIAGMSSESRFGEDPIVNMRKVGITKILQYLVGWSLCGPDNKPLPYSPDLTEAARESVLRSLDTDTYKEIRDAIDAHEDAEEQNRSARKNAPAGESVSSATSISAA